MNLRATSTFTPVALSKITALIIPKLVAAMNDSVALVQEEAQALVAVDTGELKASIQTAVEWAGNSVDGEVFSDSPHAAFNEFGTGQRGSSGPNAGEGIEYSPSWPGMTGQAFLRPAIDVSRGKILAIFEEKLNS